MKRGRPIKSEIRQNVIEILSFLGSAYGYKIHKIYCEIFNPCTIENVYYNLKKGIQVGEIEIEGIKLEKGNYSWGTTVEKKYYKLGKNAKPAGKQVVREYFEKLNEEREKNKHKLAVQTSDRSIG